MKKLLEFFIGNAPCPTLLFGTKARPRTAPRGHFQKRVRLSGTKIHQIQRDRSRRRPPFRSLVCRTERLLCLILAVLDARGPALRVIISTTEVLFSRIEKKEYSRWFENESRHVSY
jgi:hypothetical protein